MYETAAGRIWWITREARQHMGEAVQQNYQAITAAMYVPFVSSIKSQRHSNVVRSLESGMLYPITLIVATVVPFILDPATRGSNVPVDLMGVSMLMAVRTPVSPVLHYSA